MLRPKPAGALACALIALALSACGSSSSNKSTSTPTTTAASSATTGASSGSTGASSGSTSTPTSTPSGTPIVLGAICSCSGPQASLLASMGQVGQAWASSVNANGGIDGHPVKLITKDDGSNPATSLQDAKELVEKDHVIAIVGETSLADSAWAPYVAGKGIPVVGGISQEAPFLTNPDFFPSGTQLVVSIVGTIAQAKLAGKTHVGVLYCAESPVCAQVDPIAKGAAALSGLKYTSGKISATAPSYAAPCLAMKSAGVDATVVFDNAQIIQRFAAGCAQQGYKPLQVSLYTTVANSWLTDPNFDGTPLGSVNANPLDTSVPGVAKLHDALSKYAPGLLAPAKFSFDSVLPWAGGQLFEAAAKAANLTPTSTPADLKKGLYALKNETLGGLSSPLNFTPGKPAFVPCYFTAAIKHGTFVSLNNNHPTCLTGAQAKALASALG